MTATEIPVSPPRVRRPTVTFGPFTFDPDNHLLRRGADQIAAPPRVLGVLDLLLERAGDLVPRQELIDRVWKEAFVTDTSLAEAVSGLRQLLGDDAQAPTYIQTVHRRGYRFVAPVQVVGPKPAAPPASSPAIPPAPSVPEMVRPSIGGQLVPWSLAALLGILAVVAILRLTSQEPSAPLTGRFAVTLPAGQHFDPRGLAVALSSDGSLVAWSACTADECQLYVRPLDRLEPTPLAGTAEGASPFFSPDGAWLGFFADGKLKRIPLAGGAPLVIADVAEPLGAVWTREGRIIYGSSLTGGLWQVSASGGTPAPLTMTRQAEGEVRHGWPALAPDGRTLFFSIATTLDQDSPTRLAIAMLPPWVPAMAGAGTSRITTWTTPLDAVGIARPLADDLVAVARGSELQVTAIDPVTHVMGGAPQTVVSAVSTSGGQAQFAVSRTGSLLYVTQASTADDARLAWEPGGSRAGVPALPREISGLIALSPDGRRLAWAGPADGARTDIRIVDLDRGAATRLTHDGVNTAPVWSPDGRRLFVARRTSAAFQLASIDVDSGRVAPMPIVPHHAFPTSVSGDGRTLAFIVATETAKRDVWIVATGGGPARPIVQSPFDETAPALSPDGTVVAYQSDEGGRWDVYLQRIADGRRTVVSTNGGDLPGWTADGGALIFRSGAALMRAPVRTDELAVGAAERIGDARTGRPVAMTPDGRMLVDRGAVESGTGAVITLHWDQEIRRLLGPPSARMPR